MKIQISVSAASSFPKVDEALVKCANLMSDYVQKDKGDTEAVLLKYESFLKRVLPKALTDVIGDKAEYSDADADAEGMSEGSHDIYGSVVYLFKKANLKVVLVTDLDGNGEGALAVVADVLPLGGSVSYGKVEINTHILGRAGKSLATAGSKLLDGIGALVKKIGKPAFIKEYAEKVAAAEKSAKRRAIKSGQQAAAAPSKSKAAFDKIMAALKEAGIQYELTNVGGKLICRLDTPVGVGEARSKDTPPYVFYKQTGKAKYSATIDTVGQIISAFKRLDATAKRAQNAPQVDPKK